MCSPLRARRAAGARRRLAFAPLAALLCGALLGAPLSASADADAPTDANAEAGPPPPPPVETADVFRALAVLADEIELVRDALGAPRVAGPAIRVANAGRREVFHQAVGLLARARRLSAEQLGEVGGPVTLSDREEQTPADVLRVVEAAIERVRHVREGHELTARPLGATPLPVEVDETAVYHAVLAASRQLDAMLETRIAPADVDAQVAFAVAHVEALLDAMAVPSEGRRALAAPRPGRTSRDVHALLLDAFAIARRVGTDAGLEMLDARPLPDAEAGSITDADVYDVATLLVSEVVRIQERLGDASALVASDAPLGETQADAYRSTERLHARLADLEARLRARPAAPAPR
ncbi:MAG: hypothetical protein R3E88_15185 [Myxococcota bacterium]